MIYHVYRQQKHQHASTVFRRRSLGSIDATNDANAVTAAAEFFSIPRDEVALQGPNGQRVYPRATAKRRPFTMGGE